jgi:hypothetical protein
MNQPILGTAKPDAASSNSTCNRHHAVLNFSVSYELDGEQPGVLNAMLESAAQHLIANGLITGGTDAVMADHEIKVLPLSDAAAKLDEENLASFLLGQIESGNQKLEALVSQMARLALAHPAEVRAEFAERMGVI